MMKDKFLRKTLMLIIVFCSVVNIALKAQEVGKVYKVDCSISLLEDGTKIMVDKVKKGVVSILYISDEKVKKIKISKEDFIVLTNSALPLGSAIDFNHKILMLKDYTGVKLSQISTAFYVGSIALATMGAIVSCPVVVSVAGVVGVVGFVIDRVERHKTAEEVKRIGIQIREIGG